MRLCFVGGIHGSGKTTLCQRLVDSLGILHYSAGELIRMGGVHQHERQKAVRDVALNQQLLLEAIIRIGQSGARTMLLDGHYTVVNEQRMICPINVEVFRGLKPTVLMLVHAEPHAIVHRLRERDCKEYDLAFIEEHAHAEKQHAEHLSRHLNVPLLLLDETSQPEDLVHYLMSPVDARQGGL